MAELIELNKKVLHCFTISAIITEILNFKRLRIRGYENNIGLFYLVHSKLYHISCVGVILAIKYMYRHVIHFNLYLSIRSTIPEEEQNEIFNEIYTKLHELEITRHRQKHKRVFVRPKKVA